MIRLQLCAVALAFLASFALAQPATQPVKPTLWLVGDSTVRNGSRDGRGWGEVISSRFDLDRIAVENRALGGRSSRTFRTEGRWDEVLKAARPGDFVLIQFGHNDSTAPDDPQRPRGTLRGVGEETREIVHPTTKHLETVRTYGWYLRQYVREARAKGVTPVVCSYVPRAPRRGETATPELSGYGAWAKQVADEEGVAFADLFGRIAREYQRREAEQPHAVKETLFVEGDRDYTHTNAAGAEVNADAVVAEVRGLNGDAGKLAAYLKEGSSEPRP